MANDSGFVAGVMFGEHRREQQGIKPEVLESLRSENATLREQNQKNRAAAAGATDLAKALLVALHDVAPNHPLANPMEAGSNDERNRIYSAGEQRVLDEAPGGMSQ